MLALHRLRCFLHSIPTSQTRYLMTQPREIPTYARRWDPTRHIPHRPVKLLSESDEPRRNTLEHELSTTTTDEIHDPKGRHISSQDIIIGCRGEHGVKRLQHLLNLVNAKDDLDADSSASLWRAYKRARREKPTLPKYLPLKARKLLWKSQAMDFSDIQHSSARLAQLDHDYRAARFGRFAGQAAYQIERKFMRGREQDALAEWETTRRYFATTPEYLDVGARLYALAGHPDQARAVMNHLLRLVPDWSLSLSIAVFRAHTSSDLEKHHKTAKEIYSAIKARAGTSITIEIYDACLTGFLEARSLTGANEVFGDMVRDGCLGTDAHGSSINEVLRRLNLLYALGNDISRATTIALAAIKMLPRAYHNHIFGDWMKSGVVEKQPQAVAQILDMMIHQGYEPESFHFNMLLRALLRTNESPDVLKAENLGWKMIEEARLSMLKNRPAPQSRSKDIDEKARKSSVLDAKPTTRVPAASVTTFALIMHHHAENLQWEHVDYLARQLKLANIEPDATIMTVLIDNKCRQGKFAEAFRIYKSLTENPGSTASVFPNGTTIRCLWKTLRLALADPTVREATNLPSPRQLLHETLEWWVLCRSRYDADRFFQGLAAEDHGAITALILHCFSYKQDLAGSLIAVHILNDVFGIKLTEKVLEILQRQYAWVDLHDETESVRLQFGKSKNYANNLERSAFIWEQVVKRRTPGSDVASEPHGNHSKMDKKDLDLNTLSEFIRLCLMTEHPPEIVEAMIDAARKAIGMPELPIGDIDAFRMLKCLTGK